MNKTENAYTSDSISQNITEIVKKKLPEKLKTFRSISGLTTSEVGGLVNRDPSTVTLWEKGKAIPDIGTLFALGSIYQISDLNEFFDTAPPVEIKSLTKSEKELISLWRSSRSEVRAAVKTLLKNCNNK